MRSRIVGRGSVRSGVDRVVVVVGGSSNRVEELPPHRSSSSASGVASSVAVHVSDLKGGSKEERRSAREFESGAKWKGEMQRTCSSVA